VEGGKEKKKRGRRKRKREGGGDSRISVRTSVPEMKMKKRKGGRRGQKRKKKGGHEEPPSPFTFTTLRYGERKEKGDPKEKGKRGRSHLVGARAPGTKRRGKERMGEGHNPPPSRPERESGGGEEGGALPLILITMSLDGSETGGKGEEGELARERGKYPDHVYHPSLISSSTSKKRGGKGKNFS